MSTTVAFSANGYASAIARRFEAGERGHCRLKLLRSLGVTIEEVVERHAVDVCERGIAGSNAVQHPAVCRPEPGFPVEHGHVRQRTGVVAPEQLAERRELERTASRREDVQADQRPHEAAKCCRIRSNTDRQLFSR